MHTGIDRRRFMRYGNISRYTKLRIWRAAIRSETDYGKLSKFDRGVLGRFTGAKKPLDGSGLGRHRRDFGWRKYMSPQAL